MPYSQRSSAVLSWYAQKWPGNVGQGTRQGDKLLKEKHLRKGGGNRMMSLEMLEMKKNYSPSFLYSCLQASCANQP